MHRRLNVVVALTLLTLMASCNAESATTFAPLPTPTQLPVEFGGTLAGGRISDADWTETVSQTLKSVVLVENTGCGFTGTGSGWVVDSRRIVTNRHVVDGARKLRLRVRGGRTVPIESWSVSESADLALLTTTEELPSALPTSDADPTSGDLVAAVGFPLGGPQEVTRGRVLSVRSDEEAAGDASRVIRTTSPVLPGNSGGPLLDTSGRVAGVVFAVEVASGETLVVPQSDLDGLLRGAEDHRGRPCLDH